MITPEEFQNLNNNDKESNFKIASVDPNYTSGLVKLKFEGENTLSTKGYMFLNSYKPQPNDRVLLVKVADTFIIMDKIVNTVAEGGNSFANLTADNLTVTNTATVGALTDSGNLAHTGQRIGFFGKTPAVKTPLSTVNPSTFTLNIACSCINNIVTVLQSYGLF